MESPRLTASGFIKEGTKFGPFHGIIKKTQEKSQFVDQDGDNYRLTLDKSRTSANQAWLAQLRSINGEYNLRIFKEDKRLWCRAEYDIDEGQPLTAIYQSNNMEENTEIPKVPMKSVCQFCHIQFRNPANLEVHIQHYCQKIDVTPSESDSLQNANGNSSTLEFENTSSLEFVCQLCRSTFSNHSNCETHMIKLHGEPESSLCKFCTFIASNIQTLTAHMFQQHVLVYKNGGRPLENTTENNEQTNPVDTDAKYSIKKEPIDAEHVNNTNISCLKSSNNLKPNSVNSDPCSLSDPDKKFTCHKCSFKTHLQVNIDQHDCHQPEVKIVKNETRIVENKETKSTEDNVSSTTIVNTPPSGPKQSLQSCTACNITFKSARNFTAHKTYYCANRQFANDLYIAKLHKRQRVGLSEDEPVHKRTKFYLEHSLENDVTTVVRPIEQSAVDPMPMLCLSRPNSKESLEGSDYHDAQQQHSVCSQDKPLDLSVKKSPSPSSNQSSSGLAVPLVRPTSLDVQVPRAIVLGYKCIECDILFHKQESLKVHKQYYCATRHQPSPQRASPNRNSTRNGALSRNLSRSPVSPGVLMERDGSCSPSGKISPDSIQSDLQRPLKKCSPSNGEAPILNSVSHPSSSPFMETRGERCLSSPRQADRGSPGNATSPTSSQLGATMTSGTTSSVDGGTPNTLVMRYQKTPYHDTMVTSKDLPGNMPTFGTGQRKIYCVCGAVFRNYDIYVAHKENYCSYRNMMSSTATDQAVSQNNDDNHGKDKIDTIVCNICKSVFARFLDLKNHKCVSCVCPVCPFVGSNLNQLQEHFQQHPGSHLDLSSTNTFQTDEENISIPQPSRVSREGAKRRKSTTPHAIHAKQAKLDANVIKTEKGNIETVCNESVSVANLSSQNRQTVITNIKPNPDSNSSNNIANIQPCIAVESLQLSTIFTSATAEEDITEGDSNAYTDDKVCKKDSTGITTPTETDSGDSERGDVTQTTQTSEEDMTKSKKNKSNAKLCRTCDLHFNNLSTFIAHRKYYCGAGNQTTKT